jgi:hypothetical protein
LFGPEKVPLFVHKDVPPVNSTSPIPITQELPLENALAATIRCIAVELLAALDLPRLL